MANLRHEDALQRLAALGSLFNKVTITNSLNGRNTKGIGEMVGLVKVARGLLQFVSG